MNIMSWMDEKLCPICKSDDFDPDCDQVDIGVGTIEGNLRGLCLNCGEVFMDEKKGWVSQFEYYKNNELIEQGSAIGEMF